MRTFAYRCPNPRCRAVLAIPESLRGRSARCGKCSQEFVIPFFAPMVRRDDEQGAPRLKKAG